MLDLLDDFAAECAAHASCFSWGCHQPFSPDTQLYCAACGGLRRMTVSPVWTPPSDDPRRKPGGLNLAGSSTESIAGQLTPSLFLLFCFQCGSTFTAVIYKGPSGPQLAVFADHLGGLSTPHTPEPVRYYLDQAHRAHSVGATSAAVAMYRAALEYLLFEQGFEEPKTCGAKINALKKAIEEGTAPAWASQLDDAHLTVIKKLGDAAIHPNDGDTSKQSEFDSALISMVQETFAELLSRVYERERASRERLSALQAKLNAFEA